MSGSSAGPSGSADSEVDAHGGEDDRGWLAGVLADALGEDVEVVGLERLSAGASRRTDAVTVRGRGGERRSVLQRGPPAHRSDDPGGLTISMAVQAELLRAAGRGGVPVPAVVAVGRDDRAEALETEFVLVDHVDGETLPRRILRDDALGAARAGLARELGQAAARIHTIDLGQIAGPGGPDRIAGLGGPDRIAGPGGPDEVDELPVRDEPATLRGLVDALGEHRPVWELALRWLAANRPPRRAPCVVHGDLRLGNLAVDADGLAGVLDWELAHLGDPVADLGWVCVRSWRFGGPGRVGGFGDLDDLLAGYNEVSGHDVVPEEVRWWEVAGNLRWAVLCVLQARRHTSGDERSLELAAVGRRAHEPELDLLDLLAGGQGPPDPPQREKATIGWRPEPGATPTPNAAEPGAPALLGGPDAGALLAAARAVIAGVLDAARDVGLAGYRRHELRVAAHVLSQVERELAAGPAALAVHHERLAALGVAGDAELAAAIRTGDLADRHDEVLDALRATARDRVAIVDPRHLPDQDLSTEPRGRGTSGNA